MTKKNEEAFLKAFVENLNQNVARENSILNPMVQDAIVFAIQTHEIDQQQKRKGKTIPYIVHPLVVGLILAKAGALDHIIVAGILHDTVEDSIQEKKVTIEIIREKFGPSVADIVDDVTEKRKDRPWEERKKEALEHIKVMEGPSLWVKTADVISNVSEILKDHEVEGEVLFERFNAPKNAVISNYKSVITALLQRWETSLPESENPMTLDLKTLLSDLSHIL